MPPAWRTLEPWAFLGHGAARPGPARGGVPGRRGMRPGRPSGWPLRQASGAGPGTRPASAGDDATQDTRRRAPTRSVTRRCDRRARRVAEGRRPRRDRRERRRGSPPTPPSTTRPARSPMPLPTPGDAPADASADSPADAPSSVYRAAVLADSPLAYWRLGETSGTVAHDETGNGHDGTYVGGVTLGQPGALTGDANTAVSSTAPPARSTSATCSTSRVRRPSRSRRG